MGWFCIAEKWLLPVVGFLAPTHHRTVPGDATGQRLGTRAPVLIYSMYLFFS
jgi:hypothetical protein